MSSFRPDFAAEERPFMPLGIGSVLPIEAEPGSVRESKEAEVFPSGTPSSGSSEFGDNVDANPDLSKDSAARSTVPESEEERAAAWSALEAYEEAAFNRGVAEGTRAEGRIADLCEALEGAAKELLDQGSNALGSQRDLILNLASAIAQQWVGAELKLDSALFADALDRSIEACAGGESLQMILSPGDFEALSAEQLDRVDSWKDTSLIKIETREDLQPGQFLIESDTVRLDGDPHSIVAVLREVLDEALETARPGETESTS